MAMRADDHDASCMPDRGMSGDAMRIVEGCACAADARATALVASGRGSLAMVYGGLAVRQRLLAPTIDWERVFVAYLDDEPVGFVSFQWKGRGPYKLSMRDFVRQFGWIAGMLRWVLHAMLELRSSRSGCVHITGLRVELAARRRGIASALIARAEAEARRFGAATVALDVYGSNAAALCLYLRTGFHVVHHRRPWFVRRSSRVSSVLRMDKALQ
jgi:ribosomal protein S18 acetylase RimI-like enzyme